MVLSDTENSRFLSRIFLKKTIPGILEFCPGFLKNYTRLCSLFLIISIWMLSRLFISGLLEDFAGDFKKCNVVLFLPDSCSCITDQILLDTELTRLLTVFFKEFENDLNKCVRADCLDFYPCILRRCVIAATMPNLSWIAFNYSILQ